MCSALITCLAYLQSSPQFWWDGAVGRAGFWPPSIVSSFASSAFAHPNSASFRRMCSASLCTRLIFTPGASPRFTKRIKIPFSLGSCPLRVTRRLQRVSPATNKSERPETESLSTSLFPQKYSSADESQRLAQPSAGTLFHRGAREQILAFLRLWGWDFPATPVKAIANIRDGLSSCRISHSRRTGEILWQRIQVSFPR